MRSLLLIGPMIALVAHGGNFYWASPRIQLPGTGSGSFSMLGQLNGVAGGNYRFDFQNSGGPSIQNLQLAVDGIAVAKNTPKFLSSGSHSVTMTGILPPTAAAGAAAWVGLSLWQFPMGKIVVPDATFYVKNWPSNAGPMPGEMHSVSLSPTSVKGSKNYKAPTLSVNLDGPAKAGGQRVFVKSQDTSLAWLLVPSTNYFDIPAGQTSGGWSWFLGTKNVMVNKNANLIAEVNGRNGFVNLGITKGRRKNK